MPVEFWTEWNEYVRTINPEAFTMAEIWDEASSFLKEGKFSSTMNYFGFAYPVKGFVIDGQLTQSEAIRQLDAVQQLSASATQFALLNLIDSHDTDRVASMIVNAGQRTVRAAGSIRLRRRCVAAPWFKLQRAQANHRRNAEFSGWWP